MQNAIKNLHAAGFRKVANCEHYYYTYENKHTVYMYLSETAWLLVDESGNRLDSADYDHRPLTEEEVCYLMNEYSGSRRSELV